MVQMVRRSGQIESYTKILSRLTLIETSSENNLVRGKKVCELIAKTLIKLHHKWLIQNPVGHGP
ncbi:hypothetical protein YC2023_022713 [Brassica napus]